MRKPKKSEITTQSDMLWTMINQLDTPEEKAKYSHWEYMDLRLKLIGQLQEEEKLEEMKKQTALLHGIMQAVDRLP